MLDLLELTGVDVTLDCSTHGSIDLCQAQAYSTVASKDATCRLVQALPDASLIDWPQFSQAAPACTAVGRTGDVCYLVRIAAPRSSDAGSANINVVRVTDWLDFNTTLARRDAQETCR